MDRREIRWMCFYLHVSHHHFVQFFVSLWPCSYIYCFSLKLIRHRCSSWNFHNPVLLLLLQTNLRSFPYGLGYFIIRFLRAPGRQIFHLKCDWRILEMQDSRLDNSTEFLNSMRLFICQRARIHCIVIKFPLPGAFRHGSTAKEPMSLKTRIKTCAWLLLIAVMEALSKQQFVMQMTPNRYELILTHTSFSVICNILYQ